jgi:hypothetical protein
MKALCCLYGFLLEGLIPYGLFGCLLIVLVTIPSFIWFMGLLCKFLTTFGELHIIFHLVLGLFYVIGLCTVGYGGYYVKRLSLGLVAITLSLHLYYHYSVFGENHEGYAHVCSRYCLVSSKEPLLLCL